MFHLQINSRIPLLNLLDSSEYLYQTMIITIPPDNNYVYGMCYLAPLCDVM